MFKAITEHIELKNSDVDKLVELVKPYLSEKRYSHSLFVMKEAEKLGKIYLPDRINNLKAAALLHDITKIADFEKQLQYCNNFGIILDNDQMEAKEVLHAITGAELARIEFPGFVDREILLAIRYHSTGRANMSVFEAIIYLSDYIEESRTHESCVKLRELFYSRLEDNSDIMSVLVSTIITSLDNTISFLAKKGGAIDVNTVNARDYYVSLKNA